MTGYCTSGRTALLTVGPDLIVGPLETFTMNAILIVTDAEARFSSVVEQASRDTLIARVGSGSLV